MNSFQLQLYLKMKLHTNKLVHAICFAICNTYCKTDNFTEFLSIDHNIYLTNQKNTTCQFQCSSPNNPMCQNDTDNRIFSCQHTSENEMCISRVLSWLNKYIGNIANTEQYRPQKSIFSFPVLLKVYIQLQTKCSLLVQTNK